MLKQLKFKIMENYQCTYVCDQRRFNPAMNCVECWDGNTIFYFDRADIIKIGDTVKLEYYDNGITGKVWVNGILKIEETT